MRGAVRWLTGLLITVTTGACAGGEASSSRPPAAAGVVDSAIPMEEALRRFREGRAEAPGLRDGAGSREGLVTAFVRALERRDTTALLRMELDADEFAWLYYPSSPMSRPPYELPPDLMWFQMRGQSKKGASLLLSERAGAALGYVGHTCGSKRMEGENHIFGHCVVRRVVAGDTVSERLFGLIVERGGIHKFVSYANKLD